MADALRMPEAQQVITGLFLLILLRLFGSVSNGMLMLPLICPEAYSALLRTSMMVAPWAANALKSADGPMPNRDLNELNILGFVLNDATKVMVVFVDCCDNCHSHF